MAFSMWESKNDWCDSCKQKTEEDCICFQASSSGQRHIIYIHRSCLTKKLAAIDKKKAKVAA